ENVKVPKENLVGTLNGGWSMAKSLLNHERTHVATIGVSRRTILRVKRIAQRTIAGGRPLFDDPVWRQKIARFEVKFRSLEIAHYRALASAKLGHAPGPEASILKIRGTEVLQ